MDTTQISQEILDNIITVLNNNKLDYTDYIIFKRKLIKYLNGNIAPTSLRLKYNYLIKNQNEYALNSLVYKRPLKMPRSSCYTSIYLEQSNEVIKLVYSLFDCERIYCAALNKQKYTVLELTCDFSYYIYKGAYKKDICRLQLSFKKMKFKSCVTKVTFYVSFPKRLNDYCECLKQFIHIIALNFCNLKQLIIYCPKSNWDKTVAPCYGNQFTVYDEISDNSDYSLMKYINKICAKYLPKLKLLHYCSRYYNANYKLAQYNFNQYYFKVQYDNNKDNVEIGKILFGSSVYRS